MKFLNFFLHFSNIIFFSLLIRFGDFRPLKSTSCIDLPAKNRWNCKKFEDFAVKNIIKHPFYNARSGFNDIALLRLLVRVIFVGKPLY